MLFCPLPWIHQAIRNNGDIRICCIANQGPDRGLLRKDDGSIYNAEYDDLEEARNCNKLKDVRLAILNNKWHPDCIRCKRECESGIKARIIYEEETWNKILTRNQAINLTKVDGSIDTKRLPIVYRDIRFGNLCNLKCRTCGPTDSSLWYGDYYKLWGDTYRDTSGKIKIIKSNEGYLPYPDIYSWYNNESFWLQLYNNINNIKRIQIVGGEPLLITKHFELLEKLIEYGKAKDVRIEYNTNITTITERVLELWKHFQMVRMGASVDGVGKVNDYIRYPSKWKNIEKNLRLLDEAEGTFDIWITMTINILNILNLPEMMEWKLKQNYKRINNKSKPFISPHLLHGPKFLNIKALPMFAKKEIIKKFESFSFDKHQEHATKLLSEYITFMMKEDYSVELPMFWKHTNGLDKIRNQELQDYIPELYELIGETNVI